MLKIAYDYGCQGCLAEYGLAKQAGLLSPMVLGALTEGSVGALAGGIMPYLVTNGPFWDRDERAIRGALAGGLAGALWGGIARKFLRPGDISTDLIENLPGLLAGSIASGQLR